MFNTHNFFTAGDLCKSVTSNRQDRIQKHKPSGSELCKSLSLHCARIRVLDGLLERRDFRFADVKLNVL